MKLHRKGSDEISGFGDQGITVIGTLQFAGVFRIDGKFHGSISTDDTLVIGRHACVHADIKVGAVEIAGEVFGNIDARRSVEVLATGRVCGDIRTPVLVISLENDLQVVDSWMRQRRPPAQIRSARRA